MEKLKLLVILPNSTGITCLDVVVYALLSILE